MKILHPLVIVILIPGLILLSCNSKKNSAYEYDESLKIYKQAIEIHDEVMPKMGRIMELQKLLISKKEKFTDETLASEVDSAVFDLENAHENMMVWMRNITPVPEENQDENKVEISGYERPDPNEMKEIQEESLEKIKLVKDYINKSIERAESLLEKIENSNDQ
jgi:hypothetical protein